MTTTTQDVVSEYLKSTGLTVRAFSDVLTESLNGITHSTIVNWKKGVSEPNTDFLLACYTAYSDWRRDFALDCLRAKLPEVFIDNVELIKQIGG